MIRRYLLDTGIAQDFQVNRGGIRARVHAERHRGHRIGICPPVLGELWAGIEGSATRESNLKRLRHALSHLAMWHYDEKAAEEYGRIFTEMRSKGRVIQQVDMQIGAIARTLPNCIVVSKDADLQAIPGIRVEDWSSESPTQQESPG